MKKLILIILISVVSLFADEVNIKFASFVEHKVKYENLDWNEGFNNRAKGIEYIYDTNNKGHGIGITYINFINSFGNKTIAKGLVYRHRTVLTKNLALHSKVYYLHQKGYYKWQVMDATDISDKGNEFYTPMLSLGLNYKGFSIDGLVLKDTLSAFTFGYAWRF